MSGKDYVLNLEAEVARLRGDHDAMFAGLARPFYKKELAQAARIDRLEAALRRTAGLDRRWVGSESPFAEQVRGIARAALAEKSE